MQFAWLEKLAADGHISEKARAAIYRDCSQILKVASLSPAQQRIGDFMDKHQGAIGTGLTGAALLLGNRLLGAVRSNKDLTAIKKAIDSSRQAITANPEFAQYQDKARARFDELVKIAPTVAQNPELALRIIKEKIQSGFSAQDVQSLAMIQASYTPNMAAQMRLSDKVKTAAAIDAGEALATQLIMCKEAGLSWGTMGRAAQNALVLSTIPILGGVGVGAVKQVAAAKDKKVMHERLEASFNKAMELSDPDKDGLHENKDTARQAFQVLAHFSPHVAMEPNAARGFMKKLVAWSAQGPQVEDIKSLTEIERNHRQGGTGSPFFEGLASGSKALGLGHALSSSASALGKPLEYELTETAAKELALPSNWRSPGKRSD